MQTAAGRDVVEIGSIGHKAAVPRKLALCDPAQRAIARGIRARVVLPEHAIAIKEEVRHLIIASSLILFLVID